MLAKMILRLLTMCCLVTTCSSLSSYSPTSAGANTAYMKQNQYITRVLLGKNKRPMPGSSATYKAEPMEWRQALHYLDQTLQGGFIPDMKTW